MNPHEEDAPLGADDLDLGEELARDAATRLRDGLATRMIRAAVRVYRDAVNRRADVFARLVDDHDALVWQELADDAVTSAEEHLVRCVLFPGTGPTGTVYDAEKRLHRTRGVVIDGRIYLAAVDQDETDRPEGWTPKDGGTVMRLVVVDLADVANLGREGGGL